MQMKHFTHRHPLALSKYNNSPQDALCYGCKDPILINTYAYHCIDESTATQYSPCGRSFLHKTCAELPLVIQHHLLHPQHVLTLQGVHHSSLNCEICHHRLGGYTLFYKCSNCVYNICSKCARVDREINHPSHDHTLTLLPFRAILFTCTACGTEGSNLNDFSYVCLPCCFWIHKSCASAPPTLTRKDHHNDHPLVLAYSMPEQYRRYGPIACSLCPEIITYVPRWLYYCAICRYFAHVQCALSAPESAAKDGEENDDGSNVVHFPVSENEMYQLIQQFANKFTISSEEKSGKADVIRECRNGHALTLFDDFNSKSVVETNTSTDKRICDGCVLPLLSTPDPFYGCVECNFFLHNVCAAELPREIQHAFHPKKELTTFTRRCFPSSKPSESHFCNLCYRFFNGIVVYSSDEDRPRTMDIVCAALPSKIKHDSHRHTLHQVISDTEKYCRGCGYYIWTRHLSFGCEKCDYHIHIRCALQPRTMKHRWDEHEVNLMYPPVKDHPHDFDCEFCSRDINPNRWFYHCSKCDTSFHSRCIYPSGNRSYNIKYGGIVRDDSLHQHSLKFTKAGPNYPQYKCGRCGDRYRKDYPCKYKCESCKFTACLNCFIHRTD